MSDILCIDIGNSNIGMAIINQESYKILDHIMVDHNSSIESILLGYVSKSSNICITSVNNAKYNDLTTLFKKHSISYRTIHIKDCNINSLPLLSEEVGIDFYCQNVYLHSLGYKNSLVIDSGTATTFSIIEDSNKKLFVSIAPGLNAFFTSLSNHTELDYLNLKDRSYNYKIGDDTKSAVLSGCFWGYIGLINQNIDNYIDNFNISKIFFSGGNSLLIQSAITNKGRKLEYIFDNCLIYKSMLYIYNQII